MACLFLPDIRRIPIVIFTCGGLLVSYGGALCELMLQMSPAFTSAISLFVVVRDVLCSTTETELQVVLLASSIQMCGGCALL